MRKVVNLISIVLCIISMVLVWFTNNIIELRVGCFLWIIAFLMLTITEERGN